MRNRSWLIYFLLADYNRHILYRHLSLRTLIITWLVVALLCGNRRKGKFFLLVSTRWRNFLQWSFYAACTDEELFIVEGHDLLKLPFMRNGISDCNEWRLSFRCVFLSNVNLGDLAQSLGWVLFLQLAVLDIAESRSILHALRLALLEAWFVQLLYLKQVLEAAVLD